MKSSIPILALLVIASACSKQAPPVSPSATPSVAPVASSVALPPRLQEYFEQYCDDTDGMGIDFVAWHHFDVRFRQHLRATQDPELKRLFVLENLSRSIERQIRDVEKGIAWAGKGISRPLTPVESADARHRILERIDDLGAYFAFTNFAGATPDLYEYFNPEREARLNARWIAEFRERIQAATNAPGTK